MKFIISFLLCVVLSTTIFSQETVSEIPLIYDTTGYAENVNPDFGNKTEVDPLAPTVNAEMNANEAGALTYMLPIETLKGINNHQPNVALVYNSQSGNGLAGWGWNITGLSTISQGGKSKEIDGLTIGPQFDGTDPFYLDGQRLIKLNATDFVTEKYSKIKITKFLSGDYSFIVKYTDGRIAKYKEIVPGQHYISVILDELDNPVFYTYEISGNAPRLTKVSYGGTSVSSCTFFIDFQYKTRATPSKVYRNNIEYFSNKILEGIRTSSTYGGLYRQYFFTYDLIGGNTTERLRKIEISNEVGEKLKPVQFDYNLGIANGTVERIVGTNAGLAPNSETLGDVVAGDFFGDGIITNCYISKDLSGNFQLYNSRTGKISITSVGANSKLIASKTLNRQNQITERDQLIIAQTGLFAKIEVIDLPTGDKRIFDTEFQSNGTWSLDWNTGQYTLDLSKSSDNFITGDFNNDGLVDLVHFIPSTFGYGSQVNLYELGKTTGTTIDKISLNIANLGIDDYDMINVVEMDGDGIPEILTIKGNKYTVYKIDYQNKIFGIYKNIHSIQLNDFYNEIGFPQRKTPLIFGDFNGDGLTDFITPKNIYYIDKDNPASTVVKKMETEQLIWWQYLSTGTGFVVSQKDFTAQKLAYLMPSQKDVIKHSSFWSALWSGDKPSYEYTEYGATTIIATDFDHDGKTDLMSFSKFGKAKFNENKKLNDVQIQNMDVKYLNGISLVTSQYANKIFFYKNNTDAQGNILFSKLSTIIPVDTNIISPISIPLMSTNFNQLNVYKSTLTISDPITKTNISYTINNDNFTEGLIKKVDNGSGVDQVVEYMPMVEKANTNSERCYFTSGETWQYPYYVAKNNGTYYLVNKIHTLFDDKILTTEYRFENAIQKLDGKGFLGFQKNYSSDAYESVLKNGKYVIKNPFKGVFWSIQTKNPFMDNSVVLSEYGGLKKPLTRKTNTLQKFDKGNHQYLILTTKDESKDYLKKITISKSYVYDEADDLKLLSVYTEYDKAGFSLSKFTYIPEFYNGDHYFYGKFDTVESGTHKDGLSFTTKQVNTYYPNGLVLENKKYGNSPNAPPIVTTSVYYPGSSGNLKEQTVSTTGIASNTTTYEYDVTNRYVSKISTPDGHSSLYNVDYRGRLLDETSSLGLPTTYTFDNWGNIITVKDYINKTTTISKTNSTGLTGGVYNLSNKREGGIETVITFDKFDREIQSKTQSINGKWLAVKTEYDIYGRKIRYSEPFFEEDIPKWNTIEYDELNRPVKNISFNNKVVETCYEGMKVTTEDGYRKMSKTFDAMGNTVRVEDHGGIIGYSYYPNGALKETNYDGIKTTFEIDGWGNKTKIVDPSAGTFTYQYDNLSRLTREDNPKGYTLYTYDALGRPFTEKTYGSTAAENTSIEKTFYYNPTSKLPESITGTNNGQTFTYTTLYDQYFRVKGKIEQTPDFTYTSNTTFDSYGRADIVNISTTLNNPALTSISSVKNIYDGNGILVQQNNNATGAKIWHVSEMNANEQVKQMEYGNGYILTNAYLADGSLKDIRHKHETTNDYVVDLGYDYDLNKGVLNSRNNRLLGKDEKYTYDDLNRLLTEKLNNTLVNEYTYDTRGRLTSNSELGKYNYETGNYKLQNIAFNANGQNVNTQRGFATITYNAFKSPLNITLSDKENLSFSYNLLKTRYKMTSSVTGVTKLYSSDSSVEIIKNGSRTEIITYITGDAYSANYIKKTVKTKTSSSENNYFLHRDNLGSVIAITDVAGQSVEKRYFDAWGNLKALVLANNQVITDSQQLSEYGYLIDRGYTGHEHLWKAGLINMNARIYDPILRRFLSADNEVSDLFNTQAYDRYSYVLNNPLLYIDQSGNNPFLIVAIFMAACDIFIHVMDNMMSNIPFWHGLGRVVTVDALSSAISFGIGYAVKTIANFALKALVQAGMHAVSGGLMSELSGGKFISGFAAGAISSVVSSGIEGLGNLGEAVSSTGVYSNIASRNTDLFSAIMIVSGGLTGGLSSAIAGGKFWAGVKQGVITSGLNHLAHLTVYGSSIDQTATEADKDRFKELKRTYDQFIRDAKFCSAAEFLTNVFKFDEGLKSYFAGYIIYNDNEQHFVTTTDKNSPSSIDLHTGLMKDFGTATRALYHEWVHVYQHHVLKDNWIFNNHFIREYDAYYKTINNKSLPKTNYDWTDQMYKAWRNTPAYIQNAYKEFYLNLQFQLLNTH